MLFETERLYVRKWQRDDLDALYNLFNDDAIKETIAPLLTFGSALGIVLSVIGIYFFCK